MLALDQTAEAVTHLAAALGEWRGPALADLPLDGLTGLAARLDALRITAQEDYGDTLTRLGRYSAAAEHLEQVVADNPLRERPLRLLVLALAHAGRQADALTTYRQGRQRLVDELGLEPSKELQEVEAAILRDDLPRRGPAEVRQDPARSLLVALISGLDDLPTMLQLTRPVPGCPRGHRTRGAAGRGNRWPGRRARRHGERAGTGLRRASGGGAAGSSRGVQLAVTRGPDRPGSPTNKTSTCCSSRPRAACSRTHGPAALLADAACDVAVVVGEGPLQDGPLLVPFTGAEHDCFVVVIAAWFAGATSATMRLAGTAEVAGWRDASRLLANASLAVQRALGVAAEPLLVQPSPGALVSAGREAGLVVVGLSDRWRQEGLGRARTELGARRRAALPAGAPRQPRGSARPRPERDALHLDGQQSGAVTRGRRGREPGSDA